MSSPFTMPGSGVPDRGAASSPAIAPKPTQAVVQQSQGQDGVTIRPMRLKVLYTFDNQNKTNCLARWPHIIDIRTAYLDESQEIGVIELRTCLKAIVSASPELVAKLGQDYTVYAYDYSEYETPLVGQGMLSWTLASSSSTPTAPAHQSKTMVTGRVCKNILGLFSSNSQETLEVKLRLVPVPTVLQSEYIENMKKYADISRMMPNGFDAQAWTSFIQANPAILQLANLSGSSTPAVGGPQREGVGIEHVQRLLNQGSPSLQHECQPWSLHPTNDVNPGMMGQMPRPSSPALSVQSAPAQKRRGRPPKEGSKPRTRTTNSQRKSIGRQETSESGYGSNDNDDRFDGGPRKRAKVTKADVPDSGAFGQQPDSLRIAASTAASLRIHQPSAIRPSANLANSLEAPPRVPTPIAKPHEQTRRPTLPTTRSTLGQVSMAPDENTYQSPYAPSESGPNPLDSVITSPAASRNGSLGETPADLTSSPPVYRHMSTAPPSPKLPYLPKDVDSGFVSGSLDELFDDDESRPLDEEDIEIAAQYSKRSNATNVPINDPHPLIPPESPNQKITPSNQPDEKAIEISRKAARSAIGLGRTASLGNLPRSSAIASDPIRPTSLHRSQSWALRPHPQAVSDAVLSDDATAPTDSIKRNRRGSRDDAQTKKAKIQSKLAESLAAGEMPPFCDNCGAIETPTWRKAWVKIHSGTPEHVRLSDDEGGILAWQTLQTDEDGIVCLYRIFKKSLLATDQDFREVLLCNPCGLYLHKKKCMRPKETWGKAPREFDGKRKRSSQSKKAKVESLPQNPANEASQGQGGHPSDGSSPAPGAADDATNQNSHSGTHHRSPQLPVMRKSRSRSMQLSPTSKQNGLPEASAALALKKAIQSSPARLIGTQVAPIDLEELTPKPTRRLLFPSPSQSESNKSVDFSRPTSAKKPAIIDPSLQSAESDRNRDQDDKENCPPSQEDGESGFIDAADDIYRAITRPTTPTATRGGSDSDTFKTPKNRGTPRRVPPTTGDFFSSTAKALLQHPRTPKRSVTGTGGQPLGEITPFTAHLNQLFSETNESPSANFDFPSLPSLHNTPGRSAPDYNFPHFDSQDFFSTDAPMPSSPPVWFGVYEDPLEESETQGISNESGSPKIDSLNESIATFEATDLHKTQGLRVDKHGRASVNFEMCN